MTAVLDLPNIKMTAVTGNNESWIDTIGFFTTVGTSGDDLTPLPLDGISFHMQMRVVAEDPTSWVDISTDNGMLLTLGDDHNHLGFAVPVSIMSKIPAGDYVADITATADGVVRRIADVAVTIVDGVTREGVLIT